MSNPWLRIIQGPPILLETKACLTEAYKSVPHWHVPIILYPLPKAHSALALCTKGVPLRASALAVPTQDTPTHTCTLVHHPHFITSLLTVTSLDH